MAFNHTLYFTLRKAGPPTKDRNGVDVRVFSDHSIRVGGKRITKPTDTFETGDKQFLRVDRESIEVYLTPYTRTITVFDQIILAGKRHTIIAIDFVTRQPVAFIMTLEKIGD